MDVVLMNGVARSAIAQRAKNSRLLKYKIFGKQEKKRQFIILPFFFFCMLCNLNKLNLLRFFITAQLFQML
jgi:hypothetical protein